MIFWLVLLILCIAVEALTMGLTTIWFAGGALVAILASLLQLPVFLQVILFFIVSLLLLFFRSFPLGPPQPGLPLQPKSGHINRRHGFLSPALPDRCCGAACGADSVRGGRREL